LRRLTKQTRSSDGAAKYRPSAKQYYYFYIGFYLHQMVVLFYEPKLKDFYVMLVHHIVTLMLVVFSFCTGYVPRGGVGARCVPHTDAA